jgi:hypothetical protein
MPRDREKRNAYSRAYWAKRFAEDPVAVERARARCKRYFEEHKEEIRERYRKNYAANIEKMRAKNKAQRLKHREKRLATQRAKSATLKLETFEAYGGAKCYCCGETQLMFLAIDHMNNDGYEHRMKIKRQGNQLYAWLKREGFPAGYQVACHNCNHGRYLNGGLCPHQGDRRPIVKVRRKALS